MNDLTFTDDDTRLRWVCADDELTGGEDIEVRYLRSVQVIVDELEVSKCGFAVTNELLEAEIQISQES